jgi:diguanylate cyclase (GGDEF)-like protein
VILPGAGYEDAMEIAERLRVAVREREPVGVEVSLSIGVAIAEPGVVDTGDLLVRADAALYAAKASGRDLVYADSCG